MVVFLYSVFVNLSENPTTKNYDSEENNCGRKLSCISCSISLVTNKVIPCACKPRRLCNLMPLLDAFPQCYVVVKHSILMPVGLIV